MSQGAVSIDETESALDAIEIMTRKSQAPAFLRLWEGRSGSLLNVKF